MIIQTEDSLGKFLAISQPAHSWISGQLARCWGNQSFAGFEPFEEVCYAAEQHDVGFLEWESNPTLNEATGLPFTFEDLPEQLHFEIWRTGILQLRAVCPYASLLVSLHFANLCRRFHSLLKNRSESAGFLEEQKRYQETIIRALKADLHLTEALSDLNLVRNRKLLATWDLFSLELCRGRSKEFRLPEVPAGEGRTVEILVRKTGVTDGSWLVEPWPFKERAFATVCEARVLSCRFDDPIKMRRAVQDADRMTLEFRFQQSRE